jgi:hypothetical protein
MAAAITRRAQRVTSPGELGGHQLDHAFDPRAGGSGDKLSFLVSSQSRPATPSHMNGICEHQAGLRNRCVWWTTPLCKQNDTL